MSQPDQLPARGFDDARRWAVATLGDVADQLEGAPRNRAAEMLLRSADHVAELERLGGWLLPTRQSRGWLSRFFRS